MYPTIFREIRVFDHHDNRELSRVGARLHIASFNHARSRGRRLEAQNYMRLDRRTRVYHVGKVKEFKVGRK